MDEKENNKIIRKKIFENLIIAVAMMLYFILINFSYLRMEEDLLLQGIKIASLIILFFSIIIFEVAYHKDSGRIAINGIEVLVLAILTLTIRLVTARFKIDFGKYIVYLAYTFTIYYILKSIILYTMEKKKYLDSLSDIHEIVSNEPVKKEAKKRKKKENT
jgi:ABC-type multidrug transport system fused ATPase/permease subunit